MSQRPGRTGGETVHFGHPKRTYHSSNTPWAYYARRTGSACYKYELSLVQERELQPSKHLFR